MINEEVVMEREALRDKMDLDVLKMMLSKHVASIAAENDEVTAALADVIESYESLYKAWREAETALYRKWDSSMGWTESIME